MKAIRFERDLCLDGRPVKAGDVLPLTGLPADHVASVVRLGYATECDTPDENQADDKPAPKPAKK